MCTGIGKSTNPRFRENEVKKLRSSAYCRQENANVYSLILGTWGLWICRSLYIVGVGQLRGLIINLSIFTGCGFFAMNFGQRNIISLCKTSVSKPTKLITAQTCREAAESLRRDQMRRRMGRGSCSERKRGGGDFCMPDVCAIITGDGEEKKCSSSADGLLARLKSWLNTRNLFYKGQMDL